MGLGLTKRWGAFASHNNAAAVAALANANLRKRFGDFGQDLPEPTQNSPAVLRALQNAEIDKWWPILKTANVKAN